jgi:ankyrin repeat protein
MALQRDNEALATFLLDRGADPSASRSNPPTLVLALAGTPRLAPRLVERGVDVQLRIGGELPILHVAIQMMNVETVRAMLRRGAGIRSTAKDGSSVMHPLARARPETREAPGFEEAQLAMARLLLEQRADVNARDGKGVTVLHLLAAQPDSGRLVRFLIQHKAEVRARDHQGRTPLHHAVMAGAVPLVPVLLDRGARVDALDGDGRTSLHLAIEAMTTWANTGPPAMNSIGPLVRVARPSPPHEQLVSLLLRAGADIHRKDKKGMTPLGMARELSLHGVVEQLTAGQKR